MRDRLRWATPVLPSADAYAAVGHREDLDVGQNGADGDHQRAGKYQHDIDKVRQIFHRIRRRFFKAVRSAAQPAVIRSQHFAQFPPKWLP